MLSRFTQGLFALILLIATALMAVAVGRRWAFLSAPARVLGHVRYFSGWIERRRSLIESVENQLLDFYHHAHGTFWFSFALNLAGQCAAILEVYLILWLMGVRIGLFAALAIEALTKLVNVLGMFNPGNIGTYEGGNMLIAKLFGLSGAQGLTLGVIRRIRALFWAAIGGICLVVLSKSNKAGGTQTARETRIQSALTGLKCGRYPRQQFSRLQQIRCATSPSWHASRFAPGNPGRTKDRRCAHRSCRQPDIGPMDTP